MFGLFCLELACGLAWMLSATSPRLVSAGFFRVHLLVVMGLGAAAAIAGFGDAWSRPTLRGLAAGTAAGSFIASAAWLMERRTAGRVLLFIVAVTSTAAVVAVPVRRAPPQGHDGELAPTTPQSSDSPANGAAPRGGPSEGDASTWPAALEAASVVAGRLAGSLVLGSMLAAMLLGHWYLQAPAMSMVPLQRLVLAVGGALGVRTMLAVLGLVGLISHGSPQAGELGWLLALRWGAGLAAPAVVAWMVWQTLKIRSTQSATGILYVGVILTFVGELTGQLLSADAGIGL